MTKWEYQVLECRHGRAPAIISINGNPPKQIEADNVTLFGGRGLREPKLYEYLQEVGKLGWEVCGLSPSTEMDGNLDSFCVILKRPLDE